MTAENEQPVSSNFNKNPVLSFRNEKLCRSPSSNLAYQIFQNKLCPILFKLLIVNGLKGRYYDANTEFKTWWLQNVKPDSYFFIFVLSTGCA